MDEQMDLQPNRELADRYNPFSEDWRRYPSIQYRALRDHTPVHKFDGFEYPLYALTRHEDIKHMLRDPELWSSRYGQAPMYIEEQGMGVRPARTYSQAAHAQSGVYDPSRRRPA
jgi:cytochrome P450